MLEGLTQFHVSHEFSLLYLNIFRGQGGKAARRQGEVSNSKFRHHRVVEDNGYPSTLLVARLQENLGMASEEGYMGWRCPRSDQLN
jgi:hypothetical protein